MQWDLHKAEMLANVQGQTRAKTSIMADCTKADPHKDQYNGSLRKSKNNWRLYNGESAKGESAKEESATKKSATGKKCWEQQMEEDQT